METEYLKKKDPLIKMEDAQITPFFWKSYIQFDEEHPEYTVNELLRFLLKMIYVQAINLIFVYIISFLTFYLESFQYFLVFRDGGISYTLYLILFLILFYVAICTKKMTNATFKFIVFCSLSIIVIILFGNLLGLIVLNFSREQNVILLVYVIILTSTMLISFIIILTVVPAKKFSFEKLVATSTLAQLVIFIIFISIYSDEYCFIVITWLFHYLYCVRFTYDLVLISTGENRIFRGNENIPLDYMIAGLTIYIESICFTLCVVPILTLVLILESLFILFCKTDERYFDIL